MLDREKVVRALDCLSRNAQDGACNGCAYFRPFTDDPDTGWCDRTAAMADALAMLREHDVIRCKDCLHRSENHRCYADNPMRGQYVGNDWFCADGKRKEGR